MRATCRNCDFGSGPGNTEGTKKALQFGRNSGTRVDLSPMNRASVFFKSVTTYQYTSINSCDNESINTFNLALACTTLILYKFCVVG